MNINTCCLWIFLISLASCQLKGNGNEERNNIEEYPVLTDQGVSTWKRVADIPVPKDYQRTELDPSSFSWYLRNFPLDTADNCIYFFDGTLKPNQNNHVAVLDIDVGKQDLQQCADALMRLRGEYLYTTGEYDKICFKFLSDGKFRCYEDYAANDYSRAKFRKYMNYVFSYANTQSLNMQVYPKKIEDIRPGDFFLRVNPGSIGHAVIVMDIAFRNGQENDKIFLLAQSYMPAQSIHILKNLINPDLSPWYSTNFEASLQTPDWEFEKYELKSWDKH
jgi:hypothetical protein